MAHRSFEDLAFRSYAPRKPHLIEAFRGKDVVDWQGKIERQLIDSLKEEEDAKNHAYADKLRQFLQIWRAHPFTGSVNIESVQALTTPSDVLAVDDWKYQNYFSNLRDSLRELAASLEELPPDGLVEPDERGPGAGAPPNDFGPTGKPAAGGGGAMPGSAGAMAGGGPGPTAPPP